MPEPERSIEELVDIFEVTTVTAALFGNSGAGGADHAKDKARDNILRAVARLREEAGKRVEAAIALERLRCATVVRATLDTCAHPDCGKAKDGYGSCAGGHLARKVVAALTPKGGDRG